MTAVKLQRHKAASNTASHDRVAEIAKALARPARVHIIRTLLRRRRHCQSKFVYFAKTSEPDFAAIDFPAFFRVDLSGSMAVPSI
jgi:hypothetical protein